MIWTRNEMHRIVWGTQVSSTALREASSLMLLVMLILALACVQCISVLYSVPVLKLSIAVVTSRFYLHNHPVK